MFNLPELDMKKFHIQEVLASGSSGIVVKTVFETGRVLALRLVNDDNAKMLSDLLALMTPLNHDNVIKVRGLICQYNKITIRPVGFCFEYYANESVDKYLSKTDSVLSTDQFKRWMSQIASGLVYLHEKGIIHRDIKPTNLLVTSSAESVILNMSMNSLPGNLSIPVEKLQEDLLYKPPELRDPYQDKITKLADSYSFAMLACYILITKGMELPKTEDKDEQLPQNPISFETLVQSDRQFIFSVDCLLERSIFRDFSSAVHHIWKHSIESAPDKRLPVTDIESALTSRKDEHMHDSRSVDFGSAEARSENNLLNCTCSGNHVEDVISTDDQAIEILTFPGTGKTYPEFDTKYLQKSAISLQFIEDGSFANVSPFTYKKGTDDEKLFIVKDFFLRTEEQRIYSARNVFYCEKLRHAALPSVIGYLLNEKRWIKSIVFESLSGKSLNHYILDNSSNPLEQLAAEQIFSWAIELATVLEHMHEQKIAHRDLKPQNILINDNNRALMLTDLGSARENVGQKTLQHGTLNYMAPETYHIPNYCCKADTYSFGMVWYFAVAKKHPFEELCVKDEKYTLKTYMGEFLKKTTWNEMDRTIFHGLVTMIDGKHPRPVFGTTALPEVQELVKECWKQEPSERPTMKGIKSRIDELQLTMKKRKEGRKEEASDFFNGKENE